ncbi:hypothetical protein [Paenibacillus odorifer]|uniref:hypothetical protein n=1 Tax=Paenibacillus odorifer TaxID=189426 RepID=UPI0015C2FE2E|nr:hypothetical protein [Paenibacillus odorifer]
MSANIIEVYPYPSRALTRTAIRSRRPYLKAAIWSITKATVTISAILFRELFL